MTLSIIMFCIMLSCADCRVLFTVMLRVIMLNVIMMSVALLSVTLLNVVAPFKQFAESRNLNEQN
jgi:hypothetical protein